MSNLNDAIQAIKSGDQATGHRILTQFVKTNPHNDIAWLWLAVVVKEHSRKVQCLRRALEINPDNTTAKRGLEELKTNGSLVETPSLENIVLKSNKTSSPRLKTLSSRRLPNTDYSTTKKSLIPESPPKFVLLTPSLEGANQGGEIFDLYLRAIFISLIIAIVVSGIITLSLGGMNAYSIANVFTDSSMNSPILPSAGSWQKIFLDFLPSSLQAAFPMGLGAGIVVGLGVMFGYFLGVILHIRTVRESPAGKLKGALRVFHERYVELALPYDQVYKLCFEAALLTGKIQVDNREQGRIVAISSVSVRSGHPLGYTITQGDVITLDIEEADHKKTRVKISSKPKKRFRFIDNGSNLTNVETIMQFLKYKAEEAEELSK